MKIELFLLCMRQKESCYDRAKQKLSICKPNLNYHP